MMDWYGGSTASWIVMSIGMIVFWAALIALVVWLVRSLGGHRSDAVAAGPYMAPVGQNDPTTLLKRRYAGGEIERAEYDQKLKDLR
jgi:putative membrane protein